MKVALIQLQNVQDKQTNLDKAEACLLYTSRCV